MKKSCKQKVRFVLCIADSEPDIVLRKVYQVLPDESAAKSNYLRIIDETGEDYLYPAHYFVMIELPKKAERALLLASQPAESEVKTK